MMRRPRSKEDRGGNLSEGDSVQPYNASPPIGAWYVAIISVLLLVGAGIYIIYLHQQRLQWRDAANQMAIGQELLRADRDELLQKTREREAEVLALEQQFSKRATRIVSLQNQRNILQKNVARLTQDLAAAERRIDKAALSDEVLDNFAAPKKELDEISRRLDVKNQLIAEQKTAIGWLETSLAEAEQSLVQSRSEQRKQETEAVEVRLQKAVLEEEAARSKNELIEMRNAFRRGQVIRGHNASLGEVKPYLAEVGPEYWQVIEGWLEQRLERPMALPDLSAIGWSYEGARLLVAVDGPAMVMLLYADREGRPISWTIAKDTSGPMPSTAKRQAGLNLLEWHDETHAFVLAGDSDEVVLQVVAAALQDRTDEATSKAAVPAGRFFRPEFRPTNL